MRCIGYHKSHDNSQLSCILLRGIFNCIICLTSDLEEIPPAVLKFALLREELGERFTTVLGTRWGPDRMTFPLMS
jgi:hypothetical protein